MTESTAIIKIPFPIFKGLLASEHIDLRGLGKILFAEGLDNYPDDGQLSRWRSTQSAEVTQVLDEFLLLLRERLFFSRVSLVEKLHGFHSFLAIRQSEGHEKPVFFLSYNNSEQELLITRYATIYHLAGELTGFITPGPPLSGIPLGLSLPASSFMYLCALADLYRRRYYSSLLDHTTMTLPFLNSDILRIIHDTRTSGDMRWLLPHIFSLMPYEPEEILQGDLSTEVSWLLERDYIVKGNNNDEYLCSENCLDFLKLLNSGTNRLGIMNFHQDADIGIIMESVCIIRLPRAIFALNIGNDNNKIMVVLSTQNFEQLLDFTIEFLSVGSAPPRSVPEHDALQRPSSPVDRIIPNSCPSCHAPLPPNAKFCRKCGKPVSTTVKDEMRS